MINRILKAELQASLFQKKAIVLIGPRQAGKTTLLRQIAAEADSDFLWMDCDEPDNRLKLTDAHSSNLRQLFANRRLVVIDEAQRVKNIGLTLKLITDQIPEIQLIVSGSSALDLADEVAEPLTGRKFEYILYPISVAELSAHHSPQEEARLLEQRLVFGLYPDIVQHPGQAEKLLRNLSGAYLYKDVLTYGNIRRPEILEKLLLSLALQIGGEVSYPELGSRLGVSKETVENYIQLLEKAFVVFRLMPFGRNLRNELVRMRKVYFYDNGIRNALLNNFNPMAMRTDTGPLWENFLMAERRKCLENSQTFANSYFWRTTQQQGIDYIEERGGKLFAAEFKWGMKKGKSALSKTFLDAYQPSRTMVVTPENYLGFIGPEAMVEPPI